MMSNTNLTRYTDDHADQHQQPDTGAHPEHGVRVGVVLHGAGHVPGRLAVLRLVGDQQGGQGEHEDARTDD